ncbi:hypothetical protein MMC22_010695 [Lobaria immixta]|nr:hypothetical protein [Lobaria immixta]
MAESSAEGRTKLHNSGDKTISSSAATGKDGTGHQHRRERFKSLLKRPFSSALPKTPSTSNLHASVPTEDDDGKRSGNGPASTDLASGKKPEASSAARTSSGTAQASQSLPRTGNASAPAGKGYETAVSVEVPIAELWNQAYEQLREKEPILIRKYEEEISLHVSTMVGTTVAMSGLGKVRRREQMEVLVKQKLEEDEDGKWRIPLGDDRVAIRDLAGYVVSIVDWGKEFVGTVLESSPYGSIAWAGVCLLLPLILNPSKQRTSNICGLEYISDLLGRCALYEHAYHQRYEINPDGLSHKELDLTSDNYQSALKELYIRILRFQARSVCQFSRNLVSWNGMLQITVARLSQLIHLSSCDSATSTQFGYFGLS